MIKQHDHLLKIILIGSSGVGKSSILMRFAQNKFTQNYLTTIGVDFRFKTIKHNEKSIKFQIWDTAGQQRFRTITSAYYKGADGIIVVYDLTDPTSLEDIQNFWIPQAYNYCDKNIDVLLLGNKSDCQRTVNPQKAKALAEKYKFTHQEVSAKSDQKIQDSIKQFGLKILAKKQKQSTAPNTPNNINTNKKNQEQPEKKVTINNYKVSEQKAHKKKPCC